MEQIQVTACTAVCGAGIGTTELLHALREGHSGLRPNDFTKVPLPTFVGRVRGVEDSPLPAIAAEFECRNSRLAWLAMQQDDFHGAVSAACRRYGSHRVALVFGTSTSSIGATEEAYANLTADGQFPAQLRRPGIHTPHSTARFLEQALGLRNVAITVATACSSSAKAFAQGARLLEHGVADAVIVGGVDSLCGSVLFGFNSLALVSRDPCRPFDAQRNGISLGEAAAFALLERDGVGPSFLGYGESSDAHHMSTPHPQGEGARLAMSAALDAAGVDPADVDYVNLHGTASLKNDEVEAQVLAGLFPARTHASSTKGWTGHTLGAAGALEAVITMLCIRAGFMPGNLNSRTLDPACGPQIRLDGAAGRVRVAMSNSFGFGGSNCSLLFANAA